MSYHQPFPRTGAFTQLISFSTDDIDAVRRITDEWFAATEGRRTLRSQRLYVDHNRPDHYVVAAEFDSADAAAANSALPETERTAEQLAAVVTDLTYTDLDLVSDDALAGAES